MASNLIVARGGVEYVPPISLAFWRWAVVVLILLPFTYSLLINNFNIIDLDKIKLSFMSLLRVYLKNIKTDQTLQSELRELVEDFFKSKKEEKSLKLVNLVEKIDFLISS